MRHLILLLVPILAVAADAAQTARLRDSWIAIDESLARSGLVEGRKFEVAVEYELVAGPAATLVLSAHGPWIDLPDGKLETIRHHVDYPGLYATAEVKPGRGRQVFSFTVPKLHERNSLLWIARFKDGGTVWPWEHRLRGGPLARNDPPLRLVGSAPGNLFTYGEPVRFALACGSAAAPGTALTGAYQVLSAEGVEVGQGTLPVTVPAAGQAATMDIPWEGRGVFGLRLAIEGLGTAEATFARLPDVQAATAGEATRFGFHDLTTVAPDADLAARYAAARRLGLTFCRQFVSWKQVQPARGEWRLDGLERSLDAAKRHGVAMMLCLAHPPAWAMTRRYATEFEPFAFDEAGWSNSIATMTRRFKGRIAAWEWLNEIVPGAEDDPVATYLAMVRLGNAAAKREDPAVLSVMAGGLWPRSFRLGLLAAGIGQHLDVMPIHYGNEDAVSEARSDLVAASAAQVQVWDDESADGLSTWGMGLPEALRQLKQRQWAMTRFPGELTAGAQRIVWFGQGRDPAGNWDYAWGESGPRPVAATLALLASKLHHAKPQGGFAIAGSGRFHLFEVDGRAVLVAPAATSPTQLRVGSAGVTLTDDQGAQRNLACTGLDAAIPAAALPVFIEGGELDVLRGYTVPELLTSQLSLLAGREDHLRLRLTNRNTRPLACTVTLALPAGWNAAAPLVATLAAGEARIVELAVAAPPAATSIETALVLTCAYADPRLPRIELPWQLSVIDPKRLGNLLADGGFEAGGAAWSPNQQCRAEPVSSFGEGLGSQVLHMSGSGTWKSVSQSLALVPGRAYLYSAWIRVVGQQQAGSNIDQRMRDGKPATLYIPSVFSATNVPDWQYVSKVYQAPEEVIAAGFTPVAKSEAFYDNIRLTVYDGSNFRAEAVRCAKAPTIDGDLSEWAAGCPIPLLGPGQTTILDKAWKPGSANLRGVAKLAWDERSLYLAAWIDDDAQVAEQTGARSIEGDSLVLALHPANRSPGTEAKAFCYLISSASPGGGSGKHTLFRPAERSGGLSSGQLAKDSSVYELAIRREGTRTCYEVRLPWSELGASGRLGAKFGCSLQLNDNDGQGRAAIISWGDGLQPSWAPASFGSLTLVE